MTSSTSDSASEGLSSAQQRLERWGFDLSIDAVAPTVQIAMDLLQRSDRFVPPRAAEITVELTTIAAMMRVRYDEPQLTADQIDLFIRGLRIYMNSWWHE